ncbi:MAG: MBL fold metallo-hydrolase [Candidatus Schekmanbacteria bacterium]|nr:MBL fold metallo-hydrolase [Candidatus Schekmanbacteria bacterium]
MLVRFWGVRGSIPVPGPTTMHFGGNTSCVEVRADDGQLVIIDAGTGLRGLGNELMLPGYARGQKEGFVLFSHTHWDHIQGFPFFQPAFGSRPEDRGIDQFHLFGFDAVDKQLENTLRGQMEHPYFPVKLEQMGARINFHGIREGSFRLGPNVVVEAGHLNHPNGCLGFRIVDESSGKVVCYASDTEPLGPGLLDQNVVKLAHEADVFIYDAQFTPNEYDHHVGWGHSTWEDGVRLAKAARAKMLALTHHAPQHDDAAVADIEAQARRCFDNVLAAYETLAIKV